MNHRIKKILIFLVFSIPFLLAINFALKAAPSDSFIFELLKIDWGSLIFVLAIVYTLVLTALLLLNYLSNKYLHEEVVIPDRFISVSFAVGTIISLITVLNEAQFMLITAFISFVALFSFVYKSK